jgi:radical SAM protein with 4Fe4S-binding SPASM domain
MFFNGAMCSLVNFTGMRVSKVNDSLNFLSRLTLNKCVNAGKVFFSYYLSRWLGKPIMWGMPIALTIEPTTACNLGCPECPSGLKSFTRPTGRIEVNQFEQYISPLSKHLCYLSFYFQGEPYLHKGFLEMVAHASQLGVYTATSTNAHFLNDENARKTVESGLDRLIISLDGITQSTYEKYRINGSLDKVLEGTKRVLYWREKLNSKKPFIVFQFLVVRHNEGEIDAVRDLARTIGVDDLWLKTAQVYNYQEDPNSLIPAQTKYSRYRKDSKGATVPKNKLVNHCWKMWHSNVVTWDGKMVPCCFDKDATYELGDLNKDTMTNIWQGKNYHEFRKELMQSRKNIDICSNCSEGTKVWT